GPVGSAVLLGRPVDPALVLRVGGRRLLLPRSDGSPAVRPDRLFPACHQPGLPRGFRAVPFRAPGGEVEARSLNRQALRLRLSGARVLLYHAVGERVGGNPRYSVSRAQLAGHLEQIRRGGHPILPLARVWSGLGTEGM